MKQKSPHPYLSIIITGRNDNYGGDFIQRLQNFITWNTRLLEKYELETEIIFVNWNPIAENKSIQEAINWPNNRYCVNYRIIDVPTEIHKKCSISNTRKTLPFYEYLAKNTGIRRAKGTFVLAMNPDILMSEGLVRQLAKKQLKESHYYRANRIDFKNNDIKQQSKVWLKGFSYPANKSYFLTNLKNELRCAWRKNSVCFEAFFQRRNWNVYYHNVEYSYHCNVSGDFMLMHKRQWKNLHANPENTYLALHTDALMVVIAATSGLQEKVFHPPIFHQEHSRRFDATEQGNTANRDAYLYFQNESQKMVMQQKAIIYNDLNWGLANFELKEYTF